MSAAAPFIFPGGRIVAGWWRQLAPHHPQNLWITYLHLRRVEVLVRANVSRALDSLLHAVLALLAEGPVALAELDERLHIGRQLTRQFIRQLENQGLVAQLSHGACSLTEAGTSALGQRAVATSVHERRSFLFLQGSRSGTAPRFMRLQARPRQAWSATHEGEFDVSHLEACVRQSSDWKRHYAFPTDVQDIVAPIGVTASHGGDMERVPEWQRTVIVHSERLPVAVIRKCSANGREECWGFEFQQQGWHLQAGAPAFVLADDAFEVLPELANPLSLSTWREAWRTWLHSRGVDADVESCRMERSALQLHVCGSRAFVERCRSAISPAVQDDIWLLAGGGQFREALHVNLTAAPSLA